jgi:hypothetical protein
MMQEGVSGDNWTLVPHAPRAELFALGPSARAVRVLKFGPLFARKLRHRRCCLTS